MSIVLLMKGVWWLYGMKARSGTGLVMIRFASFPGVTEPVRWLTPIAYAPFRVQALKACSGVSFIMMHPSAITNRISPLGDDPGL